MRIIPAIDIIQGKCVRLTQGNYNSVKVYSNNPVEIAKKFEDHGIKQLHIVDLEGAKAKAIVNYKVLEKICSSTELEIDFGGGIKSDNDIKIAFESGVNQVTVGSTAVTNPELFTNWLKHFGADKIILGSDCYENKIAINGWSNNSDLDVIKFIQDFVKKGVTNTICTDVSKDGMLKGPSYELYKDIIRSTKINLIASGGVRDIIDIKQLDKIGCKGVIIGKALYEGTITLKEIEKYAQTKNNTLSGY